MDPKQQFLEVIPALMSYGGEAMGRLPDGRMVFIPYALPGEKLHIRLVEEKEHYARAELLEVVEASPDRITPRCVYFTACGGCHYQHIPIEKQLAIKSEILVDQLTRIGGLTNILIQDLTPSPSSWNYRNHIQFHLTPQGKLGYLKPRSKDVLAIRECHLPEGLLNLIWPQLTIQPETAIQRLALRLGEGEDVLLVLDSQDIRPPEVSLEELSISAVHHSPAGTLVIAGSDHIDMHILGRSFRVSATSFFQVNTSMAEKMVQHLLDNLPAGGALLEVYCGVGLFSAFLAPRVERLIGIESSPDACYDFVANLDEYDNVELYEAAAEDILPQLNLQPEVVLVDPPRAGLDRRVMEAILRLKPGLLAYVSCDPATLARDAQRLSNAGFQLTQISLFDVFPQTYHIESISIWARN